MEVIIYSVDAGIKNGGYIIRFYQARKQ